MTAPRSTKQEYAYRRFKVDDTASGECPFCAIKKGHEQFVSESKHFMTIRNRTPYSLWDNQGVTEHLMLIPKQHVYSLDDINDEGALEFTRLIAKYEASGYNIYARSTDSVNRSVGHHHTHLMKYDGRIKSFVMMLRKPRYIRITR